MDSSSQSETPQFNRPARAKKGANHAKKRLVVVGGVSEEKNLFNVRLQEDSLTLVRDSIENLQVNLGKMCNLKCDHCHVEAGPDRTEMVTPELMEQLFLIAEEFSVKTVDLTGGAPEMCTGFKDYVRRFRKIGCEVMVRSNLTILVQEGYEDYVDFFKEMQVHVVASMPCYSAENVDAQRGDGVFDDSIEALQKLNKAGFGVEGSPLLIDLVYNPGGASLPGSQVELEQIYKKVLKEKFDISFNQLFCITNLPIGRFYSDLKKEGKADEYDKLLRDNFNCATVQHLMCRNTLNISYDGWVYDCDFNQMIELPAVAAGKPLHVNDMEHIRKLVGKAVATGNHCFGCTAGAGSSCGGELL